MDKRVRLDCVHLNGHTIGFQTQTQKVDPILCGPILVSTRKGKTPVCLEEMLVNSRVAPCTVLGTYI